MDQINILVVDDEKEIADLDIKYLRPTMPWTDWRSWKRRRSTWCSWIS